jgi:hypothetical protein
MRRFRSIRCFQDAISKICPVAAVGAGVGAEAHPLAANDYRAGSLDELGKLPYSCSSTPPGP